MSLISSGITSLHNSSSSSFNIDLGDNAQSKLTESESERAERGKGNSLKCSKFRIVIIEVHKIFSQWHLSSNCVISVISAYSFEK